MNKIFVLFFLFTGALFADITNNEWPIYIYGDVNYMAKAFNFVAVFTSSDLYNYLLVTGIAISVIFAGFVFKNGDIKGALFGIAWPPLVLILIATPIATVHIVDKRVDEGTLHNLNGVRAYQKVSNIPMFLAATSSAISFVRYALTKMTDEANIDAGGNSMVKMGFGSKGEILKKIVESKVQYNDLPVKEPISFSTLMGTYMEDCVLLPRTNEVNFLQPLINPKGYIFDEINPDRLGDSVSEQHTVIGNKPTSCGELYNKLTEVYDDFTSEYKGRVQAQFPEISVDDIEQLLEPSFITKGDGVANLKEFMTSFPINSMYEAAALRIASNADVSATEMANLTTAASSKAKIIAEGTGSFSWVLEVLPMTIHFLFAIVIAAFSFMAITLLFVGPARGAGMLVAYTSSLLGMFLVEPSLGMVQIFVDYFSQFRAAELLASIGNPTTIANRAAYAEYIATMNGIAGITGMAAAMLVPSIATFGGFQAGAAMQGVVSRYIGNDVDTHMQKSSEQEAWNLTKAQWQTREAQEFLKAHGLKVPANMGEADYYNMVMSQMNQKASGAAMYATGNRIGSYASGVAGDAVSKIHTTIGSGVEYGATGISNVALAAFSSGVAGTAQKMQAGLALNAGGHVNSSGVTDDLKRSYRVNAADDVQKVIGRAKGLISSQAYNSDGSMSKNEEAAKYRAGLEAESRIAANKTMGVGAEFLSKSAATLNDDMSNVQRVARMGYKGQVAEGQAIKERFGAQLQNYVKVQAEERQAQSSAMGINGKESITPTSTNEQQKSNEANQDGYGMANVLASLGLTLGGRKSVREEARSAHRRPQDPGVLEQMVDQATDALVAFSGVETQREKARKYHLERKIKEAKEQELENASNISNVYNANSSSQPQNETSAVKKTIGSTSTDNMLLQNALNKLDGQIGGAMGYQNATANNPNASIMASMYQTASGIASTNAKIQELGGVKKAVAFDEAQSRMKTVGDKHSLAAEASEALAQSERRKVENRTGQKVSSEQMQEIREAVREMAEQGLMQGLRQGAQGSRDILKEVGALAGKQAGAKSAGSYEEVLQGDSLGGYVSLSALASGQRASEQFGAVIGKANKFTSQSAQAMYNNLLKQGNFTEEQLDKIFKKDGQFLSGNALMASLAENQQGRVDGLNIDGTSVSAMMSGASTRISSIDSGFVSNSGHQYKGQLSGLINDVGGEGASQLLGGIEEFSQIHRNVGEILSGAFGLLGNGRGAKGMEKLKDFGETAWNAATFAAGILPQVRLAKAVYTLTKLRSGSSWEGIKNAGSTFATGWDMHKNRKPPFG